MPDDVQALVAALPELYQPVFGHPEYDAHASRPCRDRLDAIVEVADALASRLGRPLRVLDAGCAQGFFALSLAARGHQVHGIDRSAENVALCRALAAEQRSAATFDVASFEDAAPSPERRFDLVLALSVAHHLCHERGLEAARATLREIADGAEALLVEAARREEPVYWAASLPEDPRELLAGIPFVHPIGHFSTHLSPVRRPLFFASARWCRLGALLLRFDAWRARAHPSSDDVHLGTRRYYFGDGAIAKYFDFRGAPRERNRQELRCEAEFLIEHRDRIPGLPAVLGHALADDHGWLVRESVPGRPLPELNEEGREPDRGAILRDVLDQLCALEAQGLYHGDVRVWNVVVDDAGRARLIDYGDIGPSPEDVAWPGDVFLSFLAFVHELLQPSLPRPDDPRSPRFSPDHFPPPYRAFVAALWTRPVETWTFGWIRETLERALSKPGDALIDAAAPHGSPWQAAIERYVDGLAQRQRRLSEIESALAAAHAHEHALERALSEATARSLELDAQLARTVADAASQLASWTAERRWLQEQLDAGREISRAASADLAAKAETWERERAWLARQLDDARAERASEAQRHRIAAEAAAAESADLRAALAASRTELDAVWQAKEALRSELAASREAADARAREIAAMRASLSFRITAPLRALRAWLRPGATAASLEQPSREPVLRRMALRGYRYVRARPRLRAAVLRPLSSRPVLRARLRALVHGIRAGAPPAAASGAPRAESTVNGIPVSPEVGAIAARLRSAIDAAQAARERTE